MKQIEHFKSNYTIVAPDLLGHGNSPKPRQGYKFSTMVDNMESIFKKYKKKKNIVIGHSYGVPLALYLARRQTENIQQLVLVGASIPRKSKGHGIWTLPSFILEWMRPILSRNFVQNAFHPDTDSGFVQNEQTISDTNPMYMMKALIKGIGDVQSIHLKDITVPSLIINGESDGLTPVDNARELSELLFNSKIEVVKKASHLVMMEQPDIVNQLIEDFI